MVDQRTAKVQPGDSLPFFDLSEAEGRRIQVWGYRGKCNLVIFFGHSGDCAQCRQLLKLLGSTYQHIVAEEAELLIIMPTSHDATTVKEELTLPCPVLYDDTLETYSRYGVLDEEGALQAALFVSDRFGEVYHVTLSGDEHRLSSLQELMSWLRFIGIQCPECGAPEWPR